MSVATRILSAIEHDDSNGTFQLLPLGNREQRHTGKRQMGANFNRVELHNDTLNTRYAPLGALDHEVMP